MGIKRSLDNDTEVHEVAEVQHEEMVFLSVVVVEPTKLSFQTGRIWYGKDHRVRLERRMTCMPKGRP